MRLEAVLRQNSEEVVGYLHWCPGCKQSHYINVKREGGPCWTFNGDMTNPTFGPSVRIRSGHYNENRPKDHDCWCNYEARMGKPAPFKCGVCHYFIENGQIKFCEDCTHDLSGKTVPLPDLPEGE